MRPILKLSIAFVALLLSSCLAEDNPETQASLVAPNQATSRTAVFTPTSSPTSTSTPTVSAAPVIQATISLQPTASAGPTCPFEYFFEPAPVDCPGSAPVNSAAAEQPFEGGFMVWVEAIDSIIVFFSDNSWQRFEDTWSEDQPESDPELAAPPERFQPIRGFGKVWREQPDLRQRLGWALSPELGFKTVYQPQAGQDLGLNVLFIKLFNGQIAALIDRGSDDREWIIAAAAP